MDPNKDIAFHDPNRGKEVKKGETLICKYCNAVYEEKSWKHLKDLNPALVDKMQKAVCPACHYERNHI
ncbi:hypothetical protein GF340_02175, partial [Candidatus Peregrinibacteria bacterium]|nr:hypothetical protein [Candidatus Peregrinibacteria bacterium]